MRPAERGFLLLCSHLGDPERRPLSPAQLRRLAQRARGNSPQDLSRDLEPGDLMALGYSQPDAEKIAALLSEEDLLDHYLHRARKAGCAPITWVSDQYPRILRQLLGDDAPGCLWIKGNPALLDEPLIGLVGSRELDAANLAFAREAGAQAARQGYTLVSGNARGADRAAQDACLASGGSVICVVPDALTEHIETPNILYLSEDGFDREFSKFRALSRNRIIHALGRCTLVAQSAMNTGGTWDGTVKNLRFGWSPVYHYRDGSESAVALAQMGAELIGAEALGDLSALTRQAPTLFDL